jgi:hypothetical protein
MPHSNLVSFGSWLCENAGVLRRRRMRFSNARCLRILARGPRYVTHRCSAAEISQTRRFLHFLCTAALRLHATTCRQRRRLDGRNGIRFQRFLLRRRFYTARVTNGRQTNPNCTQNFVRCAPDSWRAFRVTFHPAPRSAHRRMGLISGAASWLCVEVVLCPSPRQWARRNRRAL